jgi:hypothetical protein
MREISLMVTPGPGLRKINITDDMTVADLVAQEGLFHRSVILNGEEVSPDSYNTTYLEDVFEVWATGAVKGA